jgi:putative inorganic carbon (HCO3(-)) transporter
MLPLSFAAFLLYVFLTFFRPIELFAPELSQYRPMLWLWIGAFLLGLMRMLFQWEIAARAPHFILLLSFVIAIVTSRVAEGWAGGGLNAASAFSPSAMLFVLVAMNVTTIQKLKATCITVVAGLLWAAICAVISYHTGWHSEQFVIRQKIDRDNEDIDLSAVVSEIPALDTSGHYLWRVRGLGFLNDPNDFAQAIVMALPMLWAFVHRGRILRSLILVVAPSALLGYAILLTHSRGAVVGVASLLFFGVRKLLGGVRTALLAVAIAYVAVAVKSEDVREFSPNEASAESRIDAWWAGIQMLKSNPTFGVGAGNFTEHHPARTAHNSFVLCFAELGLVGYFIWVALLVLAYKGLSHAVNELPPQTEERRYAALLRSSLVGFLTCAWFLSRTYQPPLYFILALCAAAAHCARQHQFAAGRPAEAIPWVRDTAATMLLTIVAVYALLVSHNLFSR